MSENNWKITSASHGSALAVQIRTAQANQKIQKIGPDGRLYIDLDCKNNPTEVNQSLIMFLAQILEVNPAQIEIVAGANADKKLVSILDIDSESTQAQILSYLQQK
ncbi:MAG: DUF167 domain-containing protein [Anaerolineales bacterium]